MMSKAKALAVPSIALDIAFEQQSASNPSAIVLCDAPNKPSWTSEAPQNLTYAEASTKVRTLAAMFHSLGLPQGSVVAVQMANSVETPLTLLALLKAGLTPLILPIVWHSHEIKALVKESGAKAIITQATVAHRKLAEDMCQVAMEEFSIRFILAFGKNCPDGVLSIDEMLQAEDWSGATMPAHKTRPDLCFLIPEATAEGFQLIAWTQAAAMGAAVQMLMETKVGPSAQILSTLSCMSAAGLFLNLSALCLAGGTTIFCQAPSYDEIVECIEKYKLTHVIGAKKIVNWLACAHQSRMGMIKIVAVEKLPQIKDEDNDIESGLNETKDVLLLCIGESALVRSFDTHNAVLPFGEAAPLEDLLKIENDKDGRIKISGQARASTVTIKKGQYEAAIVDGDTRTFPLQSAVCAGGLSIESWPGVVTIGMSQWPSLIIKHNYSAINGVTEAHVETVPDRILGNRPILSSLIEENAKLSRLDAAAALAEMGMAPITKPSQVLIKGHCIAESSEEIPKPEDIENSVASVA
jgi:AMP-binding enzyme